jgi:hypothetical protein
VETEAAALEAETAPNGCTPLLIYLSGSETTI